MHHSVSIVTAAVAVPSCMARRAVDAIRYNQISAAAQMALYWLTALNHGPVHNALISWEQLELETSNLTCRLTTRGSYEGK